MINWFDKIKNILRFFGIDRAVSFGISARLWSFIASPIIMLLIVTRFSPDQQGYYYTFNSLLALQVFFDLGLMFVISQFSSHEFVHLQWDSWGRFSGEPVARQRLTDLLYKTILWFGGASLLLIVVLIPAGLIFFNQQGDVLFSWRWPWILTVIGTAINLFATPFYAIIMGSGDMVAINKRDFICTVCSSLISWAVIGFHGGLYVAFAVNVGTMAVSWGYLLIKWPELLKLAWEQWAERKRQVHKAHGFAWRKEIWPMQWRMAISSSATFFIFQLFTPVLFYYHGAIVAGQMGMTISAANILLAVGLTLISAKNPQLAKYVALAAWESLDRLFYKIVWQTTLFVTCATAAGSFLVWFFQKYYEIGNRFISAKYAILLFAAVSIQVIASLFAIYIRSHKIDPLVWITVAISVVTGISTWYLGMLFSIPGMTCGYFIIATFFILPSFWLVWKRTKRKLHQVKIPTSPPKE